MNNEQLLALEAFSSDSFLIVNKKLISIFGLNTAVFLSNLIDKYKYFQSNGMLQKDDSFFLTFEDQEEHTGLTLYTLRKCKKELVDKSIIKTRMKSIPPKEFYYIDFTELINIVKESYLRNNPVKFDRIKGVKFDRINPAKSDRNIKDNKDNNTKYKDNKDNNILSQKNPISKKPKVRKRKETLPVAYKDVLSSWNKISSESKSIPSVQKLTEVRRQKIQSRNKSMLLSADDWHTVFEEIKKSKFLDGDNDRGWKITFDWLINSDNNFTKVLEGNFQDTENNGSSKNKNRTGYIPGKYDNVGKKMIRTENGKWEEVNE